MIGRELKILRIIAGLPQWKLAQMIGLTQGMISLWEVGAYKIPSERIPAILVALGRGKKEVCRERAAERRNISDQF